MTELLCYLCLSMQDVRLELEDRQLELGKLIDDAAALTQLSGGDEQVAASIAHTQDQCHAVTTALSVSGLFCLALYWNLSS